MSSSATPWTQLTLDGEGTHFQNGINTSTEVDSFLNRAKKRKADQGYEQTILKKRREDDQHHQDYGLKGPLEFRSEDDKRVEESSHSLSYLVDATRSNTLKRKSNQQEEIESRDRKSRKLNDLGRLSEIKDAAADYGSFGGKRKLAESADSPPPKRIRQDGLSLTSLLESLTYERPDLSKLSDITYQSKTSSTKYCFICWSNVENEAPVIETKQKLVNVHQDCIHGLVRMLDSQGTR
ncbi:hypothetical protein BGZ63DRAFT_429582 [Mariannaea sp. PMI_226]|nr:hypothetical protein BGZ63DRAFT_429582 [Mariannaea sp. PMI_226]